jgi:hypothetical protein
LKICWSGISYNYTCIISKQNRYGIVDQNPWQVVCISSLVAGLSDS